MKIAAVGAFGAFPLRIAVIFQADADFEVKSVVASYFGFVLSIFWAKILVKILCVFFVF